MIVDVLHRENTVVSEVLGLMYVEHFIYTIVGMLAASAVCM